MDGRRAGQIVISLAVIGIGVAMTANGADLVPPLPDPQPAPEAAPDTTKAETPTLNPIDYQPEMPEPPGLSAVLLRLGAGTMFVVAICGGCIWMGRRWINKHGLPGVRPGEELRVVESTRLSGHCAVHLLEVGGQRVLAGTDRTGLHSLVPLPEAFGSMLDDHIEQPAEASATVKEPAPSAPPRTESGPRIVRSRRAVTAPEHATTAG